ncbi:collagen-like triple helix repeat-containing protein [Alcaligenes sp. WGS1538]|uniref:collagen-like triple helix repeat-containing protein n=1 Tax=Alcaligenes sp. WGS1538 TaxID=3366811 RepID=UPI00372D5416
MLPAGLQETGGKLGQTLDSVVAPVVDTATGLTQQVGGATGLGEPVNGLLNQTGGVVANLGEQLGNSGLPLNLGQGVGGLLTGLGNAVGSAGGLLHADPNNPAPLTAVLGHATGGLAALTDSLTGEGSLLYPLTGQLGLGGLLNGGDAAPILEPALGNVGQAVDNIIPVGLNPILGNVGETLDTVVAPVGATVTHVTQQVGDGLGVGQPINALLGGVGSVLNQTGSAVDGAAGLGLGGLLGGLGDAVASAGGLLHATEGNPNPLGATLNHATGAVASLTGGLGGGEGGLLAPVTGLVGGLTGGLAGGEANGGLLAPVTGLVGGLTGGLTGGEANGGLLAPVTGLVGGLTGGLAGGQGSASPNGGLLAPVTGLVGGLVGGLTGSPAGEPSAPPAGNPPAAANGGLLAPVNGLLGGLLGGSPR